ncbi:MAG: YqgE/AlgH family protein [Gammaproteobacteria bacterium]|nr:YqgE/AlgH family protein [Gammaproteobacteria bacterium]MCW8909221.1 YqgE/AlgH family protein [Gammaproteobacteria bacterium]MCW9004154.1 YqgE/AlgH family protein [Gammaproteobacteria bacterium]MCW9056612.1 YqgE/AlgH family protein [Gammaproteobacteria bacterium]
MDNTKLNNHFLIAMPSLDDSNFSQSVTYICEHDENGTLGITINKISDITLGEIFEQLEIKDADPQAAAQKVFIGGPVHQDRGFILHSPTGHWDSSLKITEEISLTTSKDIIIAIAHNQGPEDTFIALGYAGWGPGQLEDELSINAWLSCQASKDIVFNTPVENRWQQAAQLLGVDLQLLSHDAGHA